MDDCDTLRVNSHPHPLITAALSKAVCSDPLQTGVSFLLEFREPTLLQWPRMSFWEGLLFAPPITSDKRFLTQISGARSPHWHRQRRVSSSNRQPLLDAQRNLGGSERSISMGSEIIGRFRKLHWRFRDVPRGSEEGARDVPKEVLEKDSERSPKDVRKIFRPRGAENFSHGPVPS